MNTPDRMLNLIRVLHNNLVTHLELARRTVGTLRMRSGMACIKLPTFWGVFRVFS